VSLLRRYSLFCQAIGLSIKCKNVASVSCATEYENRLHRFIYVLLLVPRNSICACNAVIEYYNGKSYLVSVLIEDRRLRHFFAYLSMFQCLYFTFSLLTSTALYLLTCVRLFQEKSSWKRRRPTKTNSNVIKWMSSLLKLWTLVNWRRLGKQFRSVDLCT